MSRGSSQELLLARTAILFSKFAQNVVLHNNLSNFGRLSFEFDLMLRPCSYKSVSSLGSCGLSGAKLLVHFLSNMESNQMTEPAVYVAM